MLHLVNSLYWHTEHVDGHGTKTSVLEVLTQMASQLFPKMAYIEFTIKILYTQLIVFFALKRLQQKQAKDKEESIAQNLGTCQHNKNQLPPGVRKACPSSATTKPKSAEKVSF